MTTRFKGFKSEITMAAGEKVLAIYIYDVIAYWGVSAADVARALEEAGKVDRINIYINSPGGSVWEGMAIHSLLRRQSARCDVWVDSIAASMASIIAMVGKTITMMPGSMIMIHNPSGGVFGESKDMKKYAEVLDKIKANGVAIYAKRTGKTAAEIEEWMDQETWFTPQEAVESGFADVIDEGTDDDDADLMFDLSHFQNVPEKLRRVPCHAGLNDVIAKADQAALATVAIADLDDFERIVFRDRAVDQSDHQTPDPKKEQIQMDPKLMQALQKAGLISAEATRQTAVAVLALWYSVQNRTQPESVEQTIADIEAGLKFPVPSGKLLVTQEDIDQKVAQAVEAAGTEAAKSKADAVAAAVAATKANATEVLTRCSIAGQNVAFAVEMLKLDTMDQVKDALIEKLCKDRKPVGDGETTPPKADPDQKFRDEFEQLGGLDALGITVEQYIESAKEMLTAGLSD